MGHACVCVVVGGWKVRNGGVQGCTRVACVLQVFDNIRQQR